MSWQSDSSTGQCRWFPAAPPVTAAAISLDQTASSLSTGDVFIHSTRLGPRTITGTGSVQITVERLRGAPSNKQQCPPEVQREPENVRSRSGKRFRAYMDEVPFPVFLLVLTGLCLCVSDRRRQQRKPAEPTENDTANVLHPASNQVNGSFPLFILM